MELTTTSKREWVKSILNDIFYCECRGRSYHGDRRARSENKEELISVGSVEEQIIADIMESELGICTAHFLVNQHGLEAEDEPVGQTTVHNAYLRMSKQINTIKK
jgi:hypothetical protein